MYFLNIIVAVSIIESASGFFGGENTSCVADFECFPSSMDRRGGEIFLYDCLSFLSFLSDEEFDCVRVSSRKSCCDYGLFKHAGGVNIKYSGEMGFSEAGCMGGSEKIYKMIYGNDVLFSMDFEVSLLYDFLLDKYGGKNLMHSNDLWLYSRDQCNSEDCLKESYLNRMEYLEARERELFLPAKVKRVVLLE